MDVTTPHVNRGGTMSDDNLDTEGPADGGASGTPGQHDGGADGGADSGAA